MNYKCGSTSLHTPSINNMLGINFYNNMSEMPSLFSDFPILAPIQLSVGNELKWHVKNVAA